MKAFLILVLFFIFFTNIFSQKPCFGIPTIVYGGQTYHTVQIDTHCWFKENLNIGEMIPGKEEQKDNGIIEKYCYNDSVANCDKYGGLYQWAEAVQYIFTSGTQGICPKDWHLPSLLEFQTLCAEVNSNTNALEEIGQGDGNNTSGFSSLISGARYLDGNFTSLGLGAFYWSSTDDHSTAYAFDLHLYCFENNIGLSSSPTSLGNSVRCIKNY